MPGQDELFPIPAGSEPKAPLATRLRPRTFADLIGQRQVVDVLRQLTQGGNLPSIILWGPPGSGKTTLAGLLSTETNARMVAMSAVTAGVADLRKVVAEAKVHRRAGLRTVLFIDEIHRFNKAQQDVILPHVEDGTVTLIGATTENPSFEVNAALLSRARVYVLQALAPGAVRTIVQRALADSERGLGGRDVTVEPEALDRIVELADGDARVALTTLELAAAAGPVPITAALVSEVVQRRAPRYDKGGDQHYDIISAFIKSVRGSDPDAALYWLARMVEAGEDPLFIMRRMVILAAEDVGLADPQALVVAVAAQHAGHVVGMPA